MVGPGEIAGTLAIVLAAVALVRPAAAQEEGAEPAAGKVPEGLAGPSARARGEGAAAPAPAGSATGDAATGGSGEAPPGAATGAAATAAEPAGAVGGYSWSDRPRARARARPRAASVIHHYPPGTPIATYPGFRMLSGGESLVWLSVSRAVPVRAERSAGRVVYSLEGARVEVRNNTNALVTTHFPSPVSRVQLVPTATGMQLVVELREPVELTHTVSSGPRGTMILRVEAPPSAVTPATVAVTTAPEPPAVSAEGEASAEAEGSVAVSGEGRASARASASGRASVKVGKGERKKRKKRR